VEGQGGYAPVFSDDLETFGDYIGDDLVMPFDREPGESVLVTPAEVGCDIHRLHSS
jgi:hypothetical protein